MTRTATTLAIASALFAITMAQAHAEMATGEVRKIDASSQKITIKHGPLKQFDMDEGMTMVFRATDPSVLKDIKPGDKIRFQPNRVNGQFTVEKIEKTK